MSEYHEPEDELGARDRDIHRALTSLKEEIEAVDWYHQRVVTSSDPELAKILAHNRDEEMEHACMTLEWLRRTCPEWDEALKTYLFAEGSIVGREEAAESEGGDPASGRGGDLGLGSLGGSTSATEIDLDKHR